MTNDNPFTRFNRAGYDGRLLPIVQPGADISPNSSLARPDRQTDIGKTPGVRGVNGWYGLPDWQKVVSTEEMCEAWAKMEAGVGMKMGDGLVAVDIDAMDKDQAHICAQTATEILGASENRVGRSPKRAKLYRTSEPVPYSRITFDGGHVEVLSGGKQLVVSGTHPVTGLPYEWPRGVPRYEDLPTVDAALVAKYMAALAERLPAAKVDVSSLPTDRKVADPAQLIGREADVRRAVQALPNNKQFDAYSAYIEVAQAIKGALPDDDETGLELFQGWAAKWEGGSNDPDRVAADWRRCKASHSLGAQYLFSLAETLGQGNFTAAEAWFDAVPPGEGISLNPFEIADGALSEGREEIEPIRWVEPDGWDGVEPPPREWEVDGWIPRYEVTLLYGEGGVGKSLIAQQYATAAAAGQAWLGQPTRPAKVMAFFCEDSEDELHRRQLDICRAMDIKPSVLRGRLRIASRKFMDNLLAAWNRNTGEMRRTIVWEMLRADAVTWGAEVVIIDTVADTFGGSEIDRTQVNAFIKSCVGRLAQEIGGSVLVLAHPSVGGRAEGRSGSTAWANAARSRMYLQYPKGKETGNWRELVGTKANYGPKGASLRLEWASGAFKAWGKPRGPEIDLNALNSSAGSTPAALPAVEDIAERAVLECLAWAEADQMPLNLAPTSKTYAPKILKRHYERALDMLKLEDVEKAIVELQRRNVIRAASWWSGRNRVSGFTVVQAAEASVFE